MAASGGRTHPVFALWPTALKEELESALLSGARRVHDWIGGRANVRVEFAPVVIGGESVDPFFNANRPDDWAEAERLFGSEAVEGAEPSAAQPGVKA